MNIMEKLNKSETLQSKIIVNKRLDDDLPVYDGGLGANPFPLPQIMIDKLINYSDKKDYNNPEGIDELRNNIIKIYSNDNYEIEKVIVGNGLKELLYILLLSLKDEYKLYLITPCWLSYIEQSKIIGIETEFIQTSHENNYKITSERLESILSKKCSKKKVLLFNNPVNPTSTVYYRDELQDFSEVFKRNDILVISDEIYLNLTYPDIATKVESLSYYYDNVILGNSLSKEFTAGGWRLGWLTFSNKNIDIQEKCHILGSCIYSNASTPFQYVAAEMLDYPHEFMVYLNDMNNLFMKIRNYCFTRFQKIALSTSYPEAAWYFFIDFRHYQSKLNKNGIFTSDELVSYLINEIGLITLSGKCFGSTEELTLRYSFVDIISPEKKEVDFFYKIKNITKALDQLELLLGTL